MPGASIPFVVSNPGLQRCVIIKGTFTAEDDGADAFATVRMADASDESTFPVQSWPIADGLIKIIALLSPGLNKITIERGHGEERAVRVLNLDYVPLLQSPPLHLAIMVAKDSPLLIDCPPGKYEIGRASCRERVL